MHSATSSQQNAARSAKSTALLILLLRAGITAELAQLMTVSDWQKVARAARVNPPSPVTRSAVLQMIRQIETPLGEVSVDR